MALDLHVRLNRWSPGGRNPSIQAGKGWYLPQDLSALEALNWTVGSEGCGAGAAGV